MKQKHTHTQTCQAYVRRSCWSSYYFLVVFVLTNYITQHRIYAYHFTPPQRQVLTTLTTLKSLQIIGLHVEGKTNQAKQCKYRNIQVKNEKRTVLRGCSNV